MRPFQAPDGGGSRTILVTGGAGFIGCNLGRRLCGEGYRVIAVDNFSVGSVEALRGLPLEVREADIADADRWMPPGVWAVVHLAAQTSVAASIDDPAGDFRTNAAGTLSVLRAAVTRGVARFVFASSNAALGQQEGAVGETMAPRPLSPYGAGKLAGEAYCQAFRSAYGMHTTVLRFANAYGPYSKHKGSVVSRFIAAILDDAPLTIYGDGHQGRDFVHVDDVCSAIVRAVEAGEETAGEVFQIGTGRETSIVALVETLGRVTGRPTKTEYRPARRGEIRSNYSDISRARARLGFSPAVDLETGLHRTFDWFAAQAVSGRRRP